MVVGALSVVLVLVSLTGTQQFQYKHHDNDEMLRVLQDVNSKCPNITRIYTLSENSVLGVPLYVIEFSPKPGHHEPCKWFNFLKISYLLRRWYFFSMAITSIFKKEFSYLLGKLNYVHSSSFSLNLSFFMFMPKWQIIMSLNYRKVRLRN